MPAQARALDARGILPHARQRGELAEILGARRIVGEQAVHAVEQRERLAAGLALDRLGHERGGGGGDRAALPLEADVLDAVVGELQPQR